MLEQKYQSLNAVEQHLFAQVAANPAYKLILSLEQHQLESVILSLYQMENESDADFARRFLKYQTQLSIIKEFISLNDTVLKQLNGE